MKYNRIVSIGAIIIGASFLFNILSSWYFGWNPEAVSDAEKLCDALSSIANAIGVLMFFIPLMALYSKALKKLEKEEAIEREMRIHKKIVEEMLRNNIDKHFCGTCQDIFDKPDINNRCPKCDGQDHKSVRELLQGLKPKEEDCVNCDLKDECEEFNKDGSCQE